MFQALDFVVKLFSMDVLRVRMEYRKYKRGFYPFSSPAPGEECAGTTGRAAEMRATYLQSPRTPLLVAAALPPRAAINPADPLPGYRAHGIRVNAVDPVALCAAL